MTLAEMECSKKKNDKPLCMKYFVTHFLVGLDPGIHVNFYEVFGTPSVFTPQNYNLAGSSWIYTPL